MFKLDFFKITNLTNSCPPARLCYVEYSIYLIKKYKIKELVQAIDIYDWLICGQHVGYARPVIKKKGCYPICILSQFFFIFQG